MGPRDRTLGWKVGEGGRSEGPRADRTSVLAIQGCSCAAPLPFQPFLGAILWGGETESFLLG